MAGRFLSRRTRFGELCDTMNQDVPSKSKRAALVALLALLLCAVMVLLVRNPQTTPANFAGLPQTTLSLTQVVAGGSGVFPKLPEVQFPVPTFTIQSPSQYYIEGRRVLATEFYSEANRPGGVGLTLLEMRHLPRRLDSK